MLAKTSIFMHFALLLVVHTINYLAIYSSMVQIPTKLNVLILFGMQAFHLLMTFHKSYITIIQVEKDEKEARTEQRDCVLKDKQLLP